MASRSDNPFGPLGSRPAIAVLLALPGCYVLWQYLTGALAYGEVVHQTGDFSAQLLLLTLAVTPIRLTFKKSTFSTWLLHRRRELGVATFGYAAFHTVVYLIRKAEPALILEEGLRPELLTGWLAFVIFSALAATSNDVSVRRLGRTWKSLHRAVYLGAVLTFVHWVLTAFDPLMAYVHIAVLAAIWIWRFVLIRRFRAS